MRTSVSTFFVVSFLANVIDVMIDCSASMCRLVSWARDNWDVWAHCNISSHDLVAATTLKWRRALLKIPTLFVRLSMHTFQGTTEIKVLSVGLTRFLRFGVISDPNWLKCKDLCKSLKFLAVRWVQFSVKLPLQYHKQRTAALLMVHLRSFLFPMHLNWWKPTKRNFKSWITLSGEISGNVSPSYHFFCSQTTLEQIFFTMCKDDMTTEPTSNDSATAAVSEPTPSSVSNVNTSITPSVLQGNDGNV